MKNSPLYPLAFALLLFWACKKSNASHSSSDSNSWLSSATNYSLRQSIVDSFSYDSSHRLAGFQQLLHDTSSIGGVTSYSWSANFALPAGSSDPPLTYSTDLTGSEELHQLSYDGQGRIIKDSSTGSSGYVTYFSYPDGNIAITNLYDGTIRDAILDTLFMSSGNISGYRIYGPNHTGTGDTLDMAVRFGFSGVANPAYQASTATSVGPVIYTLQIGVGGLFDNLSQKAVNSISGKINFLPFGAPVLYTLTTDNDGRLIQQSGSVGASYATIVYRYY
jgi:hypothetical protein